MAELNAMMEDERLAWLRAAETAIRRSEDRKCWWFLAGMAAMYATILGYRLYCGWFGR